MFDQLIETETEGTVFKTRRSYFMVSSLVVGVLFATAVVISIFAADFGLGNSSFELTEMLTPVEIAAVEPETPQPQPTMSQSQTQRPIQPVSMSRVDEPTIVLTSTSVIANSQMARPKWPIGIGPLNTDPVGSGTSGRDNTGSGNGTNGLSITTPVANNVKEPEPPPVVKDPPTKTKVSGGVLNGKASYLPKPIYSAAAKAVGAQGKVDVQVMIDETGKVVSANAVSGHPLLRSSAEQAARNAKFTPTYLTNEAVKVTGVIIYNFMR